MSLSEASGSEQRALARVCRPNGLEVMIMCILEQD
jgi:hypothetical protein